MKGLLGKKLGMSQVFSEDGELLPVTVVEAGPCIVTQLKTSDNDGYAAVQIGYGDIKESKVNKPAKGHFAKAKTEPKRYLVELSAKGGEEYKVGQTLTADLFAVGERADIVGVSKGKGFAGIIKRWKAHGGPASHGSHFHRAPGAVGACATPSRVFKGKKLPGRMGNSRVTMQNLEIVQVDKGSNLILIKGSIPGAKGGLLLIKPTTKSFKVRKKHHEPPQVSEKRRIREEKAEEKAEEKPKEEVKEAKEATEAKKSKETKEEKNPEKG